MINRKILFITLAGAGLLAAVASQALPLNSMGVSGATSGIVLADYHEHDEQGRLVGHRRHDNGDDHEATTNCHEEEDDDGAACGQPGASMNQNAAPPNNGLFAPGSKPHAQVN